MRHLQLATIFTIASALMTTSDAMANKILQDGVDDVSLTLLPAIHDVVIKDMQPGNSIATTDIKATTTQLSFPLQSTVKCGKNSAGYSNMKVGFGAFNPTFLDALVVHSEINPSAGYTEWTGTKWLGEAPGTHNYQVSLNALKNPSKADYQFDPVAEFNKAMDQYISQGGSKLDYLRQDQVINVQRTLSTLGACWSGANISSKKFGTITVPVTIRVKYQGNPNLTNLNVAIGQQQGTIQVGVNPLKITEGKILPYAPTYVGACPADLKFRVQLFGSGKGQIKYRVNEGGTTKYQSPTLNYSGGTFNNDFTFNVPFEDKFQLNILKPHQFTLYVMAKDEKANAWPAFYSAYGTYNWSHKCTPQVNFGLGGVGPGGPTLAPKPVPGSEDPPNPGNLNLQAVPVSPTPPKPTDLKLQVAPTVPAPTPMPMQIAPQ